MIKNQIEPLVKDLDDLLELGIINEAEYTNKTEMAYVERRQQIIDLGKKLKEIPNRKIEFEILKRGEKNDVRYLLYLYGTNRVIFKNLRTKVISAEPIERIKRLVINNEIDDFLYIKMPDGSNKFRYEIFD